jgi:peptidyl-prolyl cis-trans isomerase C
MKRQFTACCLAAITTVLAGCSQKVDGTAAAKADNVAVVDGQAITRNTFNFYVQGVANKPADDLTAEQRTELLQNLIRAQVVAADATRSGLATQPETQAAMEMGRLTLLQQASSQAYLKDRKASEEELRAEYDLQVNGRSRVEYRASHILLGSEEAAKQALVRLRRGASFAQLAREQSIDSNSSSNGGDLNWFSPERMTPELSAVIAKLKKGETASAPVKTQFGWHVLQLTDTRAATPPPFESVRDQLVQYVEGKKFNAYVDSLVTKAKITKSL